MYPQHYTILKVMKVSNNIPEHFMDDNYEMHLN